MEKYSDNVLKWKHRKLETCDADYEPWCIILLLIKKKNFGLKPKPFLLAVMMPLNTQHHIHPS